jgi:hypothetical protein
MPLTNQVQILPVQQQTTKTPRYFVHAYVKNSWAGGGDSWTFAPYLTPISLNENSVHGTTTCQLAFDFGRMKREDLAAFGHEIPRDDQDKFVCLRVIQDPAPLPPTPAAYVLWVGIIPGERFMIHGIQPESDPAVGPEASGVQVINARGMDYLLDKRRLEFAPVVESGSGEPDSPDPTYQLVNVIPTFNERRRTGREFRGNRSNYRIDLTAEPNRTNTFGFSRDGQSWSFADIIEFMLTWSDQWDAGTVQEPHFRMSGDPDLLVYLDGVIEPGIVADDSSVLSVIRRMI